MTDQTWTIEELEKWAVRESVRPKDYNRVVPNTWWKTTYALLQTDGRAYKKFKQALIRAGCELCPKQYAYCHHPHMLGRCITWDDAKRISADGP